MSPHAMRRLYRLWPPHIIAIVSAKFNLWRLDVEGCPAPWSQPPQVSIYGFAILLSSTKRGPSPSATTSTSVGDRASFGRYDVDIIGDTPISTSKIFWAMFRCGILSMFSLMDPPKSRTEPLLFVPTLLLDPLDPLFSAPNPFSNIEKKRISAFFCANIKISIGNGFAAYNQH